MPRFKQVVDTLNKTPFEVGLLIKNEELKTQKGRKKNSSKVKRDLQFSRDFMEWACSKTAGFGIGASEDDLEWETVERDGHIPLKYASDKDVMAAFAC